MYHFVVFVVFGFMVVAIDGVKPNGSAQQCTVRKVCNALGNVLQRQGRLEARVKHGVLLDGGRCSDKDGSKFTLSTVKDCTTLVKSLADNHYTLDALTKDSLMCRVFAQPMDESQAYTVTAELLNQMGWRGVNSGHLGLLFNAVDENNFDFIYFRPHWAGGCYQTGYMASGKLKFVETKACPNGPPTGGVWFPVSAAVDAKNAQVYLSGVLVASFTPHFALRAHGGVFTFHGYQNVVLFRNFQIIPRISGKRCKQVLQLSGYVKVDADHGSWPQDGFCQVAFKSDDVSTSYQASSDLYNFIGRDGVNFGHLGLFFNAEDQDHYDFVYFRPHSVSGCFQTGYVNKGRPKFDGGISSTCPNGPPKGAEWFKAKVTVSNATPAGKVKVYLNGTLVTSFNPRYPIKRAGGVLVGNGYKNVIYYRNFQII